MYIYVNGTSLSFCKKVIYDTCVLQDEDSTARERSPIHLPDYRRSTGYHSDGHHSNFSSDNEDLSIRSDTTGVNRKSESC